MDLKRIHYIKCVCVYVLGLIFIIIQLPTRIYYDINDALCFYNNGLWRASVPYMAIQQLTNRVLF